jgi:Fe-S-cluster containining protein
LHAARYTRLQTALYLKESEIQRFVCSQSGLRNGRFARPTIFWYSLKNNFGMLKRCRAFPPLAMKPTAPAQRCSHCGTCCRNGGPSLHLEDRPLVEEGFIQTRYLYTIRKGEWARDPIRGGLMRVPRDIIKIKGRGRSWTCRFLDDNSSLCRIYAHRPLECRELECWDTSRIEKMYDRGRLSRRVLLSGIRGLWELIEDHERRCSHDRIQQWLKAMESPDADKAQARLAEIKAYDAELRKLMVSRGLVKTDQLDFLLGRPVEQVLRAHLPAESGTPGDKASNGEVL